MCNNRATYCRKVYSLGKNKRVYLLDVLNVDVSNDVVLIGCLGSVLNDRSTNGTARLTAGSDSPLCSGGRCCDSSIMRLLLSE